MNKKKISIIAIVLFLCLGTFVFANPNELEIEEKTVNNISNTSNQNNDNISNNQKDSYNYEDMETDDVMLDINEIDNLANSNNFYNDSSNRENNSTTQKPGNNNGTTDNNSPSIPDSGNQDSSSNNGENNDNNNSNQPDTPEIPPETGPIDYTKIKNLVSNLQQLVLSAKDKKDIISAKNYRDDNQIIQQVESITDLIIKTELETILNNVNKILDDDQKPIISGILNGSYTKENVTLIITEENLKMLIINGNEISPQEMLNIDQEGSYNIIAIDNAYNQEEITFIIDKTAPEFEIKTSNNDKPTNKNVTVTIKANEIIKEVPGWTLSKDRTTITKTFENNIIDSIIIEDLAGNTKEITYQVKNIDRDFGDVIVTTSNNGQMTNQDVTVTIIATEELQPVNGWTLSEDKKSIYKVFTKNITSYVIIKDLAGNTKKVPYQVINIDKEIPTVVKDGITYEINENNDIVVTIRTSKPILTPEGWTIKENPFVFSKIYQQDTTEIVILRDIYANQGTVTITVNRKEIIKNKKNTITQSILDSVFKNLQYSIINK